MKTEFISEAKKIDLPNDLRLDRIRIRSNSRLEGLFAFLKKIDSTEDLVPILRARPLKPAVGLNYSATLDFMGQVTDAGLEAGVMLFVGEGDGKDTYIEDFYNARTSGKAIEMLLTPPPKGVNLDNWNLRVMGTEAAQSVVGRKILVQSVLRAHGLDLLEKDPELNLELLSIASGWSRLPLDVMGDINRHRSFRGRIRGRFLDRDLRAITESQNLAKQRGLDEQVEVQCIDFLSLLRALRAAKRRGEQVRSAQLIESTGLADYLDDRELSYLFETCRILVSNNGVVAITNIISNREESYLNIVWDEMRRRTPAGLAGIAFANGFDPKKTTLVLDPTETMCTIITRPLLGSR